jgi:hypothetical protein
MTKPAIDYSKTIIYKIVCNDLEKTEVYVGTTTDFIGRKSKHKRVCKTETIQGHNCKLYQYIRENGGWENFSMIEIEKYPCNDGNEARAKERYWFETLNAKLNTQCPTIDTENRRKYLEEHREFLINYQKEYRDKNKEALLEQKKDYYIKNREHILEQKRKYWIEKQLDKNTKL